MTKYHVHIKRRAEIRLKKFLLFISNVSKRAVRLTEADFWKVYDELKHNPFQYPVDAEAPRNRLTYRKALFGDWFKAVYCIVEDSVIIELILDCRQDNQDEYNMLS